MGYVYIRGKVFIKEGEKSQRGTGMQLSGRVLASQAQSPEFNLQYWKKKTSVERMGL